MDDNPYASPHALQNNTPEPAAEVKGPLGIGRLGFVICCIGMFFFQAPISDLFAIGIARSPEHLQWILALIFFHVFIALYAWPVFYRLKNIGVNPWWCLGMFVPILNVGILACSLVMPHNFADTRKLDTAGHLLILVLCVLVAGGVLHLAKSGNDTSHRSSVLNPHVAV